MKKYFPTTDSQIWASLQEDDGRGREDLCYRAEEVDEELAALRLALNESRKVSETYNACVCGPCLLHPEASAEDAKNVRVWLLNELLVRVARSGPLTAKDIEALIMAQDAGNDGGTAVIEDPQSGRYGLDPQQVARRLLEACRGGDDCKCSLHDAADLLVSQQAKLLGFEAGRTS